MRRARLGCVLCAAILSIASASALAQIEAARAAFDKEDYETAYRLFKPLAEQGAADAQYRIGLMRKFGWGAGKDHDDAARWLRAAAEQSHPQAQAELGVLYKDGRGVARDPAQAAAWFRKAAEQGVGIAQLNLGRLYRDGSGVEKDWVEAYVWFSLALRNGYMDAISYRSGIAEKMSADEIRDAESRVQTRAGKKPGSG
jgi:uncharacterized protein